MSFFQCFLINLVLYSTEITVWTQNWSHLVPHFFRLRRAYFLCNNCNDNSNSQVIVVIYEYRYSNYYNHIAVGNIFTIYRAVYYRARATLYLYIVFSKHYRMVQCFPHLWQNQMMHIWQVLLKIWFTGWYEVLLPFAKDKMNRVYLGEVFQTI